MANWTESMEQSFEYYIVDPAPWEDKEKLENVKTCTISRDSEVETLGSATIDVTDSLGECYVRAYLVTIQNGIKEKHPLGTFLVQTPSTSFNGKYTSTSLDCYTPLLELKENPPPLGYSILKGANVMSEAYRLTTENCRAPVVKTTSDFTLPNDFVAYTEDTWLSFLSDLIANDKKHYDLDAMGRILFAPKQDLASLQSVWTYTSDNSSILYPDITMDRDLYGVPNVVEVIYSAGGLYYYERVVNNDPNSPTSTVSRGREIIHRVTNPELTGIPTNHQFKEYATQLLRELSTVEYRISYTHGYCPVRVFDCVLFDYPEAGLNNVKAKVISQSIKCEPGCPVSEKAILTKNLWR